MASMPMARQLPQGMTKETTRHPPSQKYLPPREGDEVEVHCVGSLRRNGQQFLSTRDAASEPLKYRVGAGDIMEGWDIALHNMKKGEHAKFTVPAEYAYKDQGKGESDSPTYVPPHSVVQLDMELVKCPMRQDLFEDGGVVKLELKDGPGGRQPKTGDECQITYKIKVEGAGTVTASRHMMYRLGSQQLGTMGKPIDKCLSTMKRGDEASITCQPQYGFGPGSYAGKVVETFLILEEIFEVHDMSLAQKDKTVLRKRMKESETDVRVHDTAKVKVKVLGVTADNGEKVLKEPKEFSFTAGNGEVCDALEGSVLEMKETEEALLKCDDAQAVEGGLLGLPSGLETPIMIHMQVLNVEKVPEKWDLDGGGRLERGRARREIATELYKRGRLRLACHLYELVAELFVAIDFFQAEDQPAAIELRRVALLNRAMCMLKLGNMPLVKELCSKVLKEDTSNPKALYRRAKAGVSLGEYTQAIEDLDRLLEVEPANADGKSLLREAKRLRKKTDQRASHTFAKMCTGLGQLPDREDRKEDDVVCMPDMEAEYVRIAAAHGIPLKKPEAEQPAAAAASAAASSSEAPPPEPTAGAVSSSAAEKGQLTPEGGQ